MMVKRFEGIVAMFGSASYVGMIVTIEPEIISVKHMHVKNVSIDMTLRWL